jgi:hypothetical protein
MPCVSQRGNAAPHRCMGDSCVTVTVHCAEIHVLCLKKSGAAERAHQNNTSDDASLAAARQSSGATGGWDTRPRTFVALRFLQRHWYLALNGVTSSTRSRATISGATWSEYLTKYTLGLQPDYFLSCTILFTSGAIQRVFGKRKNKAEPKKQSDSACWRSFC